MAGVGGVSASPPYDVTKPVMNANSLAPTPGGHGLSNPWWTIMAIVGCWAIVVHIKQWGLGPQSCPRPWAEPRRLQGGGCP